MTVFLFANHRDIGKVFGPFIAGKALRIANAIAIAHDTNVQELVRHELAHLFSWRWNLLAPPLLSEGLSVWLQEAWGGQPIDWAARRELANPNLKMRLLLNPRFFYSKPPQRQSCYVLAGSFTGFLIRRFGWQQYRKCYRLCNGRRFQAKFKACFGLSLEQAEWKWRNEILAMEVLVRRLGWNIRT